MTLRSQCQIGPFMRTWLVELHARWATAGHRWATFELEG